MYKHTYIYTLRTLSETSGYEFEGEQGWRGETKGKERNVITLLSQKK